MKILTGPEIFHNKLKETVHEDTQVEKQSVSLTVAAIEKLSGPGELDFGGSEFKTGKRETIKPLLRDEEDKYGWWELGGGDYLLELNETLDITEEQIAFIQPHEHLYINGASVPGLFFTADNAGEKIRIPLRVGQQGLNIKENARIATLLVFV
jgi:hypothetical protein